MNDKISLTRAQIQFLLEWTENDGTSESAVERFATLMIEERVEPTLISKVVDKIMRKMQNGK